MRRIVSSVGPLAAPFVGVPAALPLSGLAMADPYTKAVTDLQQLSLSHQAVLVAFSGGKDSLTVLDLCTKVFPTVAAFHMYLIPGMAHMDAQLQIARDRYGVEIVQLPHWTLLKYIAEGIYCPPYFDRDDLPKIKLADIHTAAREITGIQLIAHGGKKADGQWRRRAIGNQNWDDVIYPIQEWNKYDVLAYLRMQNIPIPENSLKAVKSGVSLKQDYLVWLHENHPADFAHLQKFFPYADAPIKYQEFYG